MKKHLLVLLLFTGFLQAQTYPTNPTKFGKISLNTNGISTSSSKINTQESNGEINYIDAINLPLSTSAKTYIDNKSTTTAGQTNRIYFTADNTTVTAGTFFSSSVTGKGTAASGSPSALVLGDNAKGYFNKDIISIAQPNATIGYAGTYSGNLTVSASPTPNATQQRFTVEIYRTNNGGTPIASGVTGSAVGNLGVTVVAILDSGIVNLVAGSFSNVSVSGVLTQDITLNTGERLRYHVSAQKVSSGGGNVTFGVYYGNSYNSYYDVPVVTTTDGVLNKSTVVGVKDTDALNTLNTLKEDKFNKTSNIDNTSITSYPNTPAVKLALDSKINTSEKATPNGVASLDASGRITLNQLKNIKEYESFNTIITGDTTFNTTFGNVLEPNYFFNRENYLVDKYVSDVKMYMPLSNVGDIRFAFGKLVDEVFIERKNFLFTDNSSGINTYKINDVLLAGEYIAVKTPSFGMSWNTNDVNPKLWKSSDGYSSTVEVAGNNDLSLQAIIHDLVITVDKSGKYNTISSAIDAIKNINGKHIIRINPGVYEESINLFLENTDLDLSFIGSAKKDVTVIMNYGDYYSAPMQVNVNSYFENITFKSTEELGLSDPSSYSVHSDFGLAPAVIEFFNCDFINDVQNQHNYGAGSWEAHTLRFRNCKFLKNNTLSNGASLYWHNKVANNTFNQRLEVIDCEIYSQGGATVILHDANQTNGGNTNPALSGASVLFVNNTFRSGDLSADDSFNRLEVLRQNNALVGNIYLDSASHGNNIKDLNILNYANDLNVIHKTSDETKEGTLTLSKSGLSGLFIKSPSDSYKYVLYGNDTNGSLSFYDYGINRDVMTFVDGKIGIKNVEPSEELDIVGNVKADNYIGSATLTGVSTAQTPVLGTNNNEIATAEFTLANSQAKDNQIEIGSSQNASSTWNKQTVIFTTNCTITVTGTLPNEYSFNAVTLPGVTVTWVMGGDYSWLFGTPANTTEKSYVNITRRGSTNSIILGQ